MADCSKTEVFLAEWKRMCDTFSRAPCEKCPAYDVCFEITNIDHQHALFDTVQRWSDEHPESKSKPFADDSNQRCWLYEIECEHGDCEKCWYEPHKEN